MAKRSSVDVLIEVDKADGGVLTSGLTPYITEIGGVKVTKGVVDATPFGTSVYQALLGIIKKYEPLTLKGWFDDGAEPAPDAVFNIGKVTHAVTRSFSLTIGGTKVITGELWITDYERNAEVGGYWTFTATVQFTGTIGEA